MKKYLIIFLMGLLCPKVSAQIIGEVNVLDRDMFYLQYTPPNIISDNFNYQRWSGKVSLPPIRLGKLSFFNTLGFDRHKFNYSDNTIGSTTTALDNFYNINYSLFTAYKLSDKWSFNMLAAPFILSNFDTGLKSNDISFNGNIYIERTFCRKKGGYIQIGLGIGYLTLNGNSQITPITQFKARFNKEWSVVMGLPNTYVKWDFHKKHSIKALVDINDFSANLNGRTDFGIFTNADRAVFTIVSTGLDYNYWIKSSFGISFKATTAVWANYELRDSKNEAIYEFDTDLKQPFISIGIKFNPIRNLQNSLNPL